MLLLRPLYEGRLEVGVVFGKLVELAVYYLGENIPLGIFVAAVKVDGADEGFHCIAVDVIVVGMRMARLAYVFVDAEAQAQLVKVFSLYDFGACVGQKTFVALGKTAEQQIAHHTGQYGIAQILKALIVNVLPISVNGLRRAVNKRLVVVTQIPRVEADDITEKHIKLPLMRERELYDMD